MPTNLDNHSIAQELSTSHYEEGKVSDQEQDSSVTDTDQASTEEQNYRETMCGVCSYMGYNHIPDIDNQKLSAKDNLFAASNQEPLGNVPLMDTGQLLLLNLEIHPLM